MTGMSWTALQVPCHFVETPQEIKLTSVAKSSFT